VEIMNLVAARFHLPSAATLVVLVATLAGCGAGEDDTPALCSSVDALRSSAEAVTDVQVQRGALATLQEALGKVRSDLSTVVEDATSEYADEVDAVQKAMSDLGSSVDAAVAAPTAATVAEVRAASKAVGTSLTALVDSVESTC
jgi:hypothetical protein